MSRVTVTTAGYVLVDADGTTVDHFDCPVDACWAMNRKRYPDNAARAVRRLSDGVVLATRAFFDGDSFFAKAWDLTMRGAIT